MTFAPAPPSTLAGVAVFVCVCSLYICKCVHERERERERVHQTERQTDRQTDRHTDRQTDRHKHSTHTNTVARVRKTNRRLSNNTLVYTCTDHTALWPSLLPSQLFSTLSTLPLHNYAIRLPAGPCPWLPLPLDMYCHHAYCDHSRGCHRTATTQEGVPAPSFLHPW